MVADHLDAAAAVLSVCLSVCFTVRPSVRLSVLSVRLFVCLFACLSAYQLSQGEEATPIFMPGEGNNWMIAKACFESADFM